MALSWDDFILALLGAFLGLAVSLPATYLVIDRIVDRNAKKRLEPVEKMGRERLSSKLGVGGLTTMLITLVLDVRATLDDDKPIPKEVLELTISRLKSFQSDLEIMLGVYRDVLSVEVAHQTGNVISQIEHLLEDLQFMVEILPRPPTPTQVDHIEHLILVTVQFVNSELDLLGADDTQIEALEAWLKEYALKHEHPAEGEAIPVSGRHVIR